MKRRVRPIPFPWPSSAYRAEFARLRAKGMHPKTARFEIRSANNRARWYPLKGEKCLAKTRKGTPCQAPAGMNGRCKLHGGKSTGPKSKEGKAKALAAIGQKPRDKSWPVPHPPHILAAIKRREKEIAERISLHAHARVMESGERQ